jgi:hypothetical protein
MTYRTRPHTGPDSAAILDEALAALGPLRNIDRLGDTGVTLHLLTGLRPSPTSGGVGGLRSRVTPGSVLPVH